MRSFAFNINLVKQISNTNFNKYNQILNSTCSSYNGSIFYNFSDNVTSTIIYLSTSIKILPHLFICQLPLRYFHTYLSVNSH